MELSERKLRWRFCLRRSGVFSGLVMIIFSIYAFTIATIVGGWLPLPFRLLQAVLFVVPPIILVAASGLLLTIQATSLLSPGANLAAWLDRALPCGARQWKAMRMRGRQNSLDEVADNFFIGWHGFWTALTLLGPLHTSWYAVQSDQLSLLCFRIATVTIILIIAGMITAQLKFMDTKQGVRLDERAKKFDNTSETEDKALDTSAPRDASSTLNHRRIAPPAELPQIRQRRVFRDDDDDEQLDERITDSTAHNAVKAARHTHAPIFSTLHLLTTSCLMYMTVSVCTLAMFGYFGGEVRKCLTVLASARWQHIVQAVEFAAKGGDRFVQKG